jgi:hypothetical protein
MAAMGSGSILTGHSPTKATDVDCLLFPWVRRSGGPTMNSLEQPCTWTVGYRSGTGARPHEHPPTGAWLCQGCTAAEHAPVRG